MILKEYRSKIGLMKFFALILLMLVSIASSADSWVSPIDKKYKEKFPELFNKFYKARHFLDEHRGERTQLVSAKKLLDEILLEEKEFAPAYLEYGRLYMKAGHIVSGDFVSGVLTSTETSILEAIRIEPEYADAFVLLGHLYTNKNSMVKAENALNKAKSIGTDNPWFHMNYADLLRMQGKFLETLPYYMAVINSDTDNANVFDSAQLHVALYYRDINDYEKADIWYQKVLEKKSSAWNWGEYTFFLLFHVGNVDKAIESGEKAISIMNYGLGRFKLSCAYYAKWAEVYEKNPDQAEIYFSKAVKLNPNMMQAIQEMFKYPTTSSAARELTKKYIEENK